MVLLIRFAPGFRIALAAACAWVEVRPLKFSLLNLLSASVWATVLLMLVGWYGPTYLAQYGLGGWKGALLVGLCVLGLFRALAWYERRAMERPDAAEQSTSTLARNRQ
jgi:membrane protein DedA with SNARE-associated domain